MTNTTTAFQQIADLLNAGHRQTAWNLYRQMLRESYAAGYDDGVDDASDEEA